MVGIGGLLLPILLSAVAVFLVSSLLNTVLPWHRGDYVAVPREDDFRAAVGPMEIPPGDYIVPHCARMEDMKSPAYREKLDAGPVAILTVLPRGGPSMGRSLALWFLNNLVVGVLAAYMAGRALGPGADYLDAFRFAGATAFIAYAVGTWQMAIWYGRSWGTTARATIDGLIYGLVTGGVFGWLWP